MPNQGHGPDILLSDLLPSLLSWLRSLQPSAIAQRPSTTLQSMQIRYKRTFQSPQLSALEALPDELLLAVCARLCNFNASDKHLLENTAAYSINISSLANLCLASRRLHGLVTPILYYFVCQPSAAVPDADAALYEKRLRATRLRTSTSMRGADERFQHTRVLDADSLSLMTVPVMTAMPCLRSIRVSHMFWASAVEISKRMQISLPAIEGFYLSNSAAFRAVHELVPLDLQWAVFEEDGRSPSIATSINRRHKIRSVTFKSGKLQVDSLIMATLDLTCIRELEIDTSDRADFENFWHTTPLLPNLERLTLVLYDDILDASCLIGKIPACAFRIVRFRNSELSEDPIYLTLPQNIRSLCPDPGAILRQDSQLHIALVEGLPGLEEIVIPSASQRSMLLSARDYAEGVSWLRKACEERSRTVRFRFSQLAETWRIPGRQCTALFPCQLNCIRGVLAQCRRSLAR